MFLDALIDIKAPANLTGEAYLESTSLGRSVDDFILVSHKLKVIQMSVQKKSGERGLLSGALLVINVDLADNVALLAADHSVLSKRGSRHYSEIYLVLCNREASTVGCSKVVDIDSRLVLFTHSSGNTMPVIDGNRSSLLLLDQSIVEQVYH